MKNMLVKSLMGLMLVGCMVESMEGAGAFSRRRGSERELQDKEIVYLVSSENQEAFLAKKTPVEKRSYLLSFKRKLSSLKKINEFEGEILTTLRFLKENDDLIYKYVLDSIGSKSLRDEVARKVESSVGHVFDPDTGTVITKETLEGKAKETEREKAERGRGGEIKQEDIQAALDELKKLAQVIVFKGDKSSIKNQDGWKKFCEAFATFLNTGSIDLKKRYQWDGKSISLVTK